MIDKINSQVQYPIFIEQALMYTLSDFKFILPKDLIAQTALPERSASRLLVVEAIETSPTNDAQVKTNHALLTTDESASAKNLKLKDCKFVDLPDLLQANDLLICNDTRVIKARLFGYKASGGKVEILIERIVDERTALAQIKASKSPALDSQLHLADAFTVRVGERVEQFYTLHFDSDCHLLIEQYGQLPLPPYISHQADAYDEQRYQTLFATNPGAVAAPTAGLHFDEVVFNRLKERGIAVCTITLHVGAGTFMPVRTENLAEHKMHSENYSIPPATIEAIKLTKARGGKIIAVGTTTLRALESAAKEAEIKGHTRGTLLPHFSSTNLFITPGYSFQVVDCLITNFHLPESTLLILVSAFAGYQRIKDAYQHAIEQQYRFFSYGDAMLLQRAK